ncbi:MAG: hypothetical protein WCD13_15955 [Pseudolabrys sp.]
MAFGIYLSFSPIGDHLGMVSLPLSYFGWLAGILLGYCLLTQLEPISKLLTAVDQI